MSGAGDLEAFLDETPGETRGVVARNGRYTHLLVAREDDVPQQRLGARLGALGREVRNKRGTPRLGLVQGAIDADLVELRGDILGARPPSCRSHAALR